MPYRDKSKIGRNLKRLRIERDITQVKLSEKSGILRPQISGIENGRISPEEKTLLDILIKGFDIPYSQATNLIAEWRIEEALGKAANPSQVINNIKMGKNSKYYNFEGDNISIGDIN